VTERRNDTWRVICATDPTCHPQQSQDHQQQQVRLKYQSLDIDR